MVEYALVWWLCMWRIAAWSWAGNNSWAVSLHHRGKWSQWSRVGGNALRSLRIHRPLGCFHAHEPRLPSRRKRGTNSPWDCSVERLHLLPLCTCFSEARGCWTIYPCPVEASWTWSFFTQMQGWISRPWCALHHTGQFGSVRVQRARVLPRSSLCSWPCRNSWGSDWCMPDRDSIAYLIQWGRRGSRGCCRSEVLCSVTATGSWLGHTSKSETFSQVATTFQKHAYWKFCSLYN